MGKSDAIPKSHANTQRMIVFRTEKYVLYTLKYIIQKYLKPHTFLLSVSSNVLITASSIYLLMAKNIIVNKDVPHTITHNELRNLHRPIWSSKKRFPFTTPLCMCAKYKTFFTIYKSIFIKLLRFIVTKKNSRTYKYTCDQVCQCFTLNDIKLF